MKLKQYLTIGVLIGFGISLVGLCYEEHLKKKDSTLISSEKAKEIMLHVVPEGRVRELSYDKDSKIPKYDGTLVTDEYEYNIDVNARTGKIIRFDKEKVLISNSNSNDDSNSSPGTTQNNYISEEEIKAIISSNMPGAIINKFYFDNGTNPKYEATFVKDNTEYRITIDAISGNIKEFDKSYVGTDDEDYDYDDNQEDDDEYDD